MFAMACELKVGVRWGDFAAENLFGHLAGLSCDRDFHTWLLPFEYFFPCNAFAVVASGAGDGVCGVEGAVGSGISG